MTLRSTRILGNETAGPASSRVRAGPWPMPAPSSPSRIGTSVRVAKYMKAPEIPANRLARTELPPTAEAIQAEGNKPSCPGRPSINPAISTPARSKGMICLAKPQLAVNQS